MTDPTYSGTRTWDGQYEFDYGSDNGNTYETAVTTLADPTVGDLNASNYAFDASTLSESMQLTANDLSDGQGNSIDNVSFYAVASNYTGPLVASVGDYLGTVENGGSDGWSVTVDTSGMAGEIFYALAQDSDGVVGFGAGDHSGLQPAGYWRSYRVRQAPGSDG